MSKSRDAFRTISEVADWLDTPAHVLRFWESKFSQVKPVKRAGGRRYYRPADMELLGGIKKLLHEDGMTIKGVQKVLREQGVRHVSALSSTVADAGQADDAGTLIEDAPFTEVAEDRSVSEVVAFPTAAKRASDRPAPASPVEAQEAESTDIASSASGPSDDTDSAAPTASADERPLVEPDAPETARAGMDHAASADEKADTESSAAPSAPVSADRDTGVAASAHPDEDAMPTDDPSPNLPLGPLPTRGEERAAQTPQGTTRQRLPDADDRQSGFAWDDASDVAARDDSGPLDAEQDADAEPELHDADSNGASEHVAAESLGTGPASASPDPSRDDTPDSVEAADRFATTADPVDPESPEEAAQDAGPSLSEASDETPGEPPFDARTVEQEPPIHDTVQADPAGSDGLPDSVTEAEATTPPGDAAQAWSEAPAKETTPAEPAPTRTDDTVSSESPLAERDQSEGVTPIEPPSKESAVADSADTPKASEADPVAADSPDEPDAWESAEGDDSPRQHDDPLPADAEPAPAESDANAASAPTAEAASDPQETPEPAETAAPPVGRPVDLPDFTAEAEATQVPGPLTHLARLGPLTAAQAKALAGQIAALQSLRDRLCSPRS